MSNHERSPNLSDVDYIRRRSSRSSIWMVLRAGAASVVSFGVFWSLARILSPHDLGSFALAVAITELMRIVVQAGLPDAIVRVPSLDDRLASTAFWTMLGFAGLITIFVVILAYPYARFVNAPDVAPLLAGLALTLPVTALGSIHVARISREFGHRYLAMITTAAVTTGGTLAILSASMGFGAWSLVIQAVVTETIVTLGCWRFARWVPRLVFDVISIRKLFTFSASMLVSQIIWVALVRVQDVIIGRALGTDAVSQYRIAWRVLEAVFQVSLVPLVGVSNVSLAKLQNDHLSYLSIYCRQLATGCLIACPLIFGFGITADLLLPTLFGEKWNAAIPIAQVLSLLGPAAVLNFNVGPAFASRGQSSVIMRLAGCQLILTIAGSIVAVRYGAAASAAAYVAAEYCMVPYQLILLRRRVGVPTQMVASALWPPTAAATGMALSILTLQPSLHAFLSGPVAYLIANVLLGGLIYLGILFFCFRNFSMQKIADLKFLGRSRFLN